MSKYIDLDELDRHMAEDFPGDAFGPLSPIGERGRVLCSDGCQRAVDGHASWCDWERVTSVMSSRVYVECWQEDICFPDDEEICIAQALIASYMGLDGQYEPYDLGKKK